MLTIFNCFPLFQLPRRRTNQLVWVRNHFSCCTNTIFLAGKYNVHCKAARGKSPDARVVSVPRHANCHHHHHHHRRNHDMIINSLLSFLYAVTDNIYSSQQKHHHNFQNCQNDEIAKWKKWKVNMWKVDILSLNQISVKCPRHPSPPSNVQPNLKTVDHHFQM